MEIQNLIDSWLIGIRYHIMCQWTRIALRFSSTQAFVLIDLITFLLDTTIGTGCSSILDNIVTHIFKQLSFKGMCFIGNLINSPKHRINFWLICLFFSAFPTKKLRRNIPCPENDMFLKVIEMHPEILQGILSNIVNIVMFEECKNQWSLSRPLLGLILLYEDYFQWALLFFYLITHFEHAHLQFY